MRRSVVVCACGNFALPRPCVWQSALIAVGSQSLSTSFIGDVSCPHYSLAPMWRCICGCLLLQASGVRAALGTACSWTDCALGRH